MQGFAVSRLHRFGNFYPLCIAFVKANRLLYGLRLRSLGAGGGAACTGGAEGYPSNLFLAIPPGLARLLPPFLASRGLRDRRRVLRFEKGLGLRSRLSR